MKLFLTIIVVALVAAFGFTALFTALNIGSQVLEKSEWGSYQYIVSDGSTYWYTNSYEEKDGCISFTDNYQNFRKYCEKYTTGANYFHTKSPTLITAFWGVQ